MNWPVSLKSVYGVGKNLQPFCGLIVCSEQVVSRLKKK